MKLLFNLKNPTLSIIVDLPLTFIALEVSIVNFVLEFLSIALEFHFFGSAEFLIKFLW